MNNQRRRPRFLYRLQKASLTRESCLLCSDRRAAVRSAKLSCAAARGRQAARNVSSIRFTAGSRRWLPRGRRLQPEKPEMCKIRLIRRQQDRKRRNKTQSTEGSIQDHERLHLQPGSAGSAGLSTSWSGSVVQQKRVLSRRPHWSQPDLQGMGGIDLRSIGQIADSALLVQVRLNLSAQNLQIRRGVTRTAMTALTAL